MGNRPVMAKRVWAVFSVAVMLLAGACNRSEEVSVANERPDTIALGGLWIYHFASLEEMTATADLVVSGEVTSIVRGRTLNADDPRSTTITVRDVTITISETFKGTAPGATVTIEESGYRDDGTSYEFAEMPWSRLGDRGVFFLVQASNQPVDRYVQIVPEGRILTHYNVDGEFQAYDTAEVFAHSTLGTALDELAPDSVAGRIRQSVTTVVDENIEPQEPDYSVLAELEVQENRGDIGNTGAGSDGTGPATSEGTTFDTTGNPATTGQETPQ